MSISPQLLSADPYTAQVQQQKDLARQVDYLQRNHGRQGAGSIGDNQVGTVSVAKLAGTLDATHSARVDVGSMQGTLLASHALDVNVGALAGTLDASHAARVDVGSMQGTLLATHALNVNVGALEGTLDATHAARVNVGVMTGILDASHAMEVNVGALSGSLTALDNADISVGALTGTLSTGDAARITVATLTGTLTSADPARVAASALSVANLAAITAELGDLTIADTGGRLRTGPAGTVHMEFGRGIATNQGTYSGMVSVDASGNVTGIWNAATGDISIKGELRSGSTGLGNLDAYMPGSSTAALFVPNPGGAGVTLVADSISTRELAAQAVAAENIVTDTLGAHTITLSDGGKVRTGPSNPRVEMSSIGLTATDSAGVTSVALTPASGLDLEFSPAAEPPSEDRAITWYAGAGKKAEIYAGGASSAIPELRLHAFSSSSGSAKVSQIAYKDSGAVGSHLTVRWDDLTPNGSVTVECNGHSRVLVSDTGFGSFEPYNSDERMKRDIRPLPAGALAQVLALQGKVYRWREKKGPPGEWCGLLAQDVIDVVPEAVGVVDEELTVERGSIIAVLVEGTKELTARVTALEEAAA